MQVAIPHDDGLESWLPAAQRGDRRAAERVLRALLPRVRNLVRYLVRGDSHVDDMAQQALIAILRNGMTLLNFTAQMQDMLKGIVLIIAIVLDNYLNPRDTETDTSGDL